MSSPNIACILTVQAATEMSKAVQDKKLVETEKTVDDDTSKAVEQYDDMDMYENTEPHSVFMNTSDTASANWDNISSWLPEFDDDLEDHYYEDIEPDKVEDQLDQDEGPDPEEKFALYKQYMMHRKF